MTDLNPTGGSHMESAKSTISSHLLNTLYPQQGPHRITRQQKKNARLKKMQETLEVLTQQNEKLLQANLTLQLKCERYKQKRKGLKELVVELKEQNASFECRLQQAAEKGVLDDEMVKLANDLSGSFVIFNTLSESAVAPTQSLSSSFFDLQFLPMQGSSFTSSIIRNGSRLKPHFREYVWLHEPTDLEKGVPGWARDQIKFVNLSARMVQKAQIKISEYKVDPLLETFTMDEIFKDIKAINADETATNWEDLEIEENAATQEGSNDVEANDENMAPANLVDLDFEEPIETTIGDNPMTFSLCNFEKMRNVTTIHDLMERLELLCSEKQLQLGRTLTYLNKHLQEKIESRRIAAEEQERAAAEEQRKKVESQKKAAAEAVKLEQEWKEASSIAREVLKKSLGKVEQERVQITLNECNMKWEVDTVEALAKKCRKHYVQAYLEALRAHPQYATIIHQFHPQLEDGFI